MIANKAAGVFVGRFERFARNRAWRDGRRPGAVKLGALKGWKMRECGMRAWWKSRWVTEGKGWRCFVGRAAAWGLAFLDGQIDGVCWCFGFRNLGVAEGQYLSILKDTYLPLLKALAVGFVLLARVVNKR